MVRKIKALGRPGIITFGFISLITLLYTFYDFYDYRWQREKQIYEIGQQASQDISQKINQLLGSIKNRADHLADSLSKINVWDEQELLRLLKETSVQFPDILGVAVAFEPGVFEGRPLYCPYYDKNKGNFIFIEEVYDYRDKALGATTNWYTQVLDHGVVWTEPYFAQGAQTIVADYGIAFYDPQDKRKIAGTITMTISLRNFTKLLNALSLGKTGYGFVISKGGNILAHPVKDYVNNKNILELAKANKNQVLGETAKQMMAGKDGFVEFSNPVSGHTSYLFYQHIQQSKWSLGIVFIKNEMLGNPILEREKKIHIALALSLTLLALFAWLWKSYRFRILDFWYLNLVSSVLILGNIIFIWYLTLSHKFDPNNKENTLITSYTELNRFKSVQRNTSQETHLEPLISIPTGIYVQELEFLDSYNVNISGYVWQKYADTLPKNLGQGFIFPQISPSPEALNIEEEYREKNKDYELIRWNFRATLRLNFNYSTYPFDRSRVDIKITHHDFHRNVMLVPDLESYKLLTPSSKPGTNQALVLPSAEIVSSFFEYVSQSYNTNFGHDRFARTEQRPELVFNLVLKRKFMNSFVTHIIPILVVALMLYFVVYSSSKRKRNFEEAISSLGVVESAAAFFFVLVVAHIELRKTIQANIITYMEYFYFITYFILVLAVFNIILFTRKDKMLFFDYHDNVIVKLLYWPTFLGLCLLVTLIKFY